jgi:hypothetical protein
MAGGIITLFIFMLTFAIAALDYNNLIGIQTHFLSCERPIFTPKHPQLD